MTTCTIPRHDWNLVTNCCNRCRLGRNEYAMSPFGRSCMSDDEIARTKARKSARDGEKGAENDQG